MRRTWNHQNTRLGEDLLPTSHGRRPDAVPRRAVGPRVLCPCWRVAGGLSQFLATRASANGRTPAKKATESLPPRWKSQPNHRTDMPSRGPRSAGQKRVTRWRGLHEGMTSRRQGSPAPSWKLPATESKTVSQKSKQARLYVRRSSSQRKCSKEQGWEHRGEQGSRASPRREGSEGP